MEAMTKFASIFNSNTALIFGVFLTLGGLQNFSLFVPGISVIIGTLAYVSARNRNLDISKTSIVRRIFEILCLLLIVLVVALQNDLIRIIIEDPFTNIFIPAWIVTAYLTTLLDDRFLSKRNMKKSIGVILGLFITVNIVLFYTLYYSIPIKEYISNIAGQTENTKSQFQNQLQEDKKQWQLSLYSEGATLMRLDYDSKESCLSAGNFYFKDGSTQYKRFDCGYNCIGNKSDLSAGQLCTTVCDNYGCN